MENNRIWVGLKKNGGYDWSTDYVQLVTDNDLLVIGCPNLSNEELKTLREGTQEEVDKLLSLHV